MKFVDDDDDDEVEFTAWSCARSSFWFRTI